MPFPAPETGLEMILTAPGRSRQRLRGCERFSGLVHNDFFMIASVRQNLRSPSPAQAGLVDRSAKI